MYQQFYLSAEDLKFCLRDWGQILKQKFSGLFNEVTWVNWITNPENTSSNVTLYTNRTPHYHLQEKVR